MCENSELVKAKASKIVMMVNMLRTDKLPITSDEQDAIIKLICSDALMIHKLCS